MSGDLGFPTAMRDGEIGCLAMIAFSHRQLRKVTITAETETAGRPCIHALYSNGRIQLKFFKFSASMIAEGSKQRLFLLSSPSHEENATFKRFGMWKRLV